MSTAHKSSKHTAQAAEKKVENFIPLYTKNVERLAGLQKKSLEVAAEQNAELIGAWKQAFSFIPENPGLFWFDLAGQTFDRFVEIQKGAIDMAVEQSEAAAGLAKEHGGSAYKVAEGVTTLFKQSVEKSVATQKKAIEFYAEQQKAAFEAGKKQFGIANNPAADAFQSGVDALIETHKTILDIAVKPFKSTVAA